MKDNHDGCVLYNGKDNYWQIHIIMGVYYIMARIIIGKYIDRSNDRSNVSP